MLAMVVPCFLVSGLRWYRVEIGFALVCVGIKFVLCCCVGSGCAMFCGAVGFFFFFFFYCRLVVVVVVAVVVVGVVDVFLVVEYIILL